LEVNSRISYGIGRRNVVRDVVLKLLSSTRFQSTTSSFFVGVTKIRTG
jgi:hypothetical protein